MRFLKSAPRFSSLRLKVLFATSVILVLLALTFYRVSQMELEGQLNERQLLSYQRQQLDIVNALNNSEASLKHMASILAATQGLGESVEFTDRTRLDDKIVAQWPTLQLDVGVDEVKVFDRQSRQLAQRGHVATPDNSREHFFSYWVQKVLEKEQPLSRLVCRTTCRQYAFSPILRGGQSVGVIMLSVSIADIARYININKKSALAIMVDNVYSSSSEELPAWGANVVAATDRATTLERLALWSTQYDKNALRKSPVRVRFDDQYYHLMAFPLNDQLNGLNNTAYVVIISDITESYSSIQSDSRRVFMIAILGWLLAEMAVFLLLWRPMSNLRRVIGSLPLLSQSRFHEFSEAVQLKGRVRDEVGTLQRTAIEVASQLQRLQQALYKSNDDLTQHVKELAHEKEFVDRLLFTANAFIVTHSETSGIVLANQFALGKLSCPMTELKGRCFRDVFLQVESFDYGNVSFHTESRVPGKKDMVIEWYHSPIQNLSDDEEGYWVSVGVDITEKKAAESRLIWLANRDPLTGLYNRRYFNVCLQQSLEAKASGAVFYLDLDQFKEVNELSGHGAGDRLLSMVAQKLTQLLPEEAVIARLGGDEFAVLLEGYDCERAVTVARSINSGLSDINFIIEERRHRAMASIGVAIYPEHGDTTEAIMANADCAMYIAKENPLRDWYVTTAQDLDKAMLEDRVYWNDLIKAALDEKRFEFFVQPIMTIASEDVRHYELLLRLPDGDGGFFSPGQFIPVAERNGRIIDIDRHVIDAGVRYLSGLGDISMSINISGKSLRDQDLAQYLETCLATHGADPARLIIEITETEAVIDFGLAQATLSKIKSLGCSIALDDFGSGFSSFKYLNQLPSDYVKIDGEFIINLYKSSENKIIVSAIAEVCRSFGKQVIAEFVEDKATFDYLKAIGVEYAQGYWVGRPAHIDTITRPYNE
ncbi:bifunctional diguanylate cyclase/phosphodiesterase [Larsenimonas salina]|uniref:bifunctional diguanylate cyclase/phosphodiesterase n=1 Tax=Larsenimonas salina TaxID=1295565 RepID=UPI002072EE14|nr:EAL domain-containing protein [Larsenimonas salina]MCM5704169.1 EAL domain-containing protein [Larsenimonas salina]